MRFQLLPNEMKRGNVFCILECVCVAACARGWAQLLPNDLLACVLFVCVLTEYRDAYMLSLHAAANLCFPQHVCCDTLFFFFLQL